MHNDNDTIAARHPDYVDYQVEFDLISALKSGSQAMRDAGELYLPKFSKEQQAPYDRRKNSSYLHPGFSDAIEKQTSKPFSRPIAVEGELDKKMAYITDDVDGRGTTITTLAKQAFAMAASYRRVLLFTDYSIVNLPSGASKSDEVASRASIFSISDKDFFNWRYGSDGKFDEIRFYSSQLVPKGDFGQERQSVIYRWTRKVWEKWIVDDDNDAAPNFTSDVTNDEWKMSASGPNPLGEIPVKEVWFRRDKTTNAELADACLQHYQEMSDQMSIVKFSRTGVWLATGFDDGELDDFTVGPNSILSGQDQDAKLSVVEHSGSAVAIGRAELSILEDRIESLSVKPIERSSGDVTATEVNTNSASQSSDIRSWGISLQEGLEGAIEFAHLWAKKTMPEEFRLEIYQDYSIEGSVADVPSLIEAARENLISKELFLQELKRRGAIDARLVVADELEKLNTEEEKRKADEMEVLEASKPEPAVNNNSMQDN